MRIKLGSHKNLTSEFKDFSRTFQGFPEPKCHYFQSNILASKGATIQLMGVGGGGGGVGAVFELNKLSISFLICKAVFFYIFNIYFTWKKILSIKFDPNEALVLMIRSSAEQVSTNSKCRLVLPSEARAQKLGTNKYLFTTRPSDDYLYTVSRKFGLKIFILKKNLEIE